MSHGRRSPTVLVADDSAHIALLVSELVEEAGATVVGPAADGLEALRLYHEARPDAAVLDVQMPGMNGIDVVRSIRAAEASRCTIVVMTSHSEPEIRQQAMAAGADHFLLKGVDIERLLEIVPALRPGPAGAADGAAVGN